MWSSLSFFICMEMYVYLSLVNNSPALVKPIILLKCVGKKMVKAIVALKRQKVTLCKCILEIKAIKKAKQILKKKRDKSKKKNSRNQYIH